MRLAPHHHASLASFSSWPTPLDGCKAVSRCMAVHDVWKNVRPSTTSPFVTARSHAENKRHQNATNTEYGKPRLHQYIALWSWPAFIRFPSVPYIDDQQSNVLLKCLHVCWSQQRSWFTLGPVSTWMSDYVGVQLPVTEIYLSINSHEHEQFEGRFTVNIT